MNIFDKHKEFISYCIDINPKKQGKHIAITGHKILSPEHLMLGTESKNILIVNENYFDEIVEQYSDTTISFYKLEKILNEEV